MVVAIGTILSPESDHVVVAFPFGQQVMSFGPYQLSRTVIVPGAIEAMESSVGSTCSGWC
jgi:hypothetical protein